MRKNLDLDPKDAATLRAWRASNLIGWGVVGAAGTWSLAIATSVVTERLAEQGADWTNAATLLMVVVAGGAGGAVIGSKVYRSPGTVAFCSQQASFLGWLLWQSVVVGDTSTPMGIVYQWVFSLMFALPAVITARIIWRRRPAALRAGI